ncbi:hypothetical protein MET9862_03491 [Methylobacterium symbioticum]|uniref:Uncharacterized protein n=1 Tax=Methylobacterium symbioticum TaxID=2584084 RepID=A0A509EGW0_9HYPH|nr:hypothetical protein MET9862_03491 [Methylobacterium symbioticum]
MIPKRAAPSKAGIAPDYDEFGKVVASGILSDALLPALGQLTGRRLGLLAFMRRENILRYNGVWVYRPQSHQMRDGRWEPVPFKTGESLGLFVLHDLFAECGFIEWALRNAGPVFPMLMRTEDPADAAQKRLKRLYARSGRTRSAPVLSMACASVRSATTVILRCPRGLCACRLATSSPTCMSGTMGR